MTFVFEPHYDHFQTESGTNRNRYVRDGLCVSQPKGAIPRATEIRKTTW